MILERRRIAKEVIPEDWDYLKCQQMSFVATEKGLYDYSFRLIERSEKLFAGSATARESRLERRRAVAKVRDEADKRRSIKSTFILPSKSEFAERNCDLQMLGYHLYECPRCKHKHKIGWNRTVSCSCGIYLARRETEFYTNLVDDFSFVGGVFNCDCGTRHREQELRICRALDNTAKPC